MFVFSSGGGGGKSIIVGTYASPKAITAGTGIGTGAGLATSKTDQVIYVVGASSTHSDITANPQIVAHTKDGARLRIIGTSDSAQVILDTGNGLELEGSWAGGDGNSIDLFWDNGQTKWRERCRNA